jgi:hypothetical protein
VKFRYMAACLAPNSSNDIDHSLQHRSSAHWSCPIRCVLRWPTPLRSMSTRPPPPRPSPPFPTTSRPSSPHLSSPSPPRCSPKHAAETTTPTSQPARTVTPLTATGCVASSFLVVPMRYPPQRQTLPQRPSRGPPRIPEIRGSIPQATTTSSSCRACRCATQRIGLVPRVCNSDVPSAELPPIRATALWGTMRTAVTARKTRDGRRRTSGAIGGAMGRGVLGDTRSGFCFWVVAASAYAYLLRT